MGLRLGRSMSMRPVYPSNPADIGLPNDGKPTHSLGLPGATRRPQKPFKPRLKRLKPFGNPRNPKFFARLPSSQLCSQYFCFYRFYQAASNRDREIQISNFAPTGSSRSRLFVEVHKNKDKNYSIIGLVLTKSLDSLWKYSNLLK